MSATGQEDFSWWNEKHHWDGHSPWNQYLTISTSFLGPNALPVPAIANGAIDSTAQLTVAYDYISATHEHAFDLYTRVFLPLFNRRAAIAVEVIPYETFSTDTLIRDIRASRGRSGRGSAGGDICFTTLFTMFSQTKIRPSVLFRATIRTASGTNLGEARYTDAPGYYFDVSAGKDFQFRNSSLKIFLLSGFYVYQTYDVQHLQNDCFLYGGGVEWSKGKIKISQAAGGYSGYLNIGDKPLVSRTGINFNTSRLTYSFGYETGIRDYDFNRLRFGITVLLKKM